MPDNAATILTNGSILTMNPESPLAQALAVDKDGRVAAIGDESDVLNIAGAETQVINLRGRTLLPGFFDCHIHILDLGLKLGQVDLSSPPVNNPSDIISLLRERLIQNPGLNCLLGSRYNQNSYFPPDHPSRKDLDAISTSLPIYISHTSGHAAVVNSKALQMLGISRDTSDPVGGSIVRDEFGEPTGLLLETAAWENLERIIPPPSLQEQVEALQRASQYLLERGITSASDASTLPEELEAYKRAVWNESLQVRVNNMISWAEVIKRTGVSRAPSPADFQIEGVSGHLLHVGQAKLFSDGAITTRTCRLTQPFEGMPDNFGIFLHPPEELALYIARAHRAGWQIATHAIGDAAIDLALSAYSEAQRQYPRPLPGHRIEHCMLLDSTLISRLRRQKVWAIGQPEFLMKLGDAYIMALGEERASRLSPYSTLDARDIAQAFSSDCPVVPGAPLDGIRASMERSSPTGRILNEAERISPETALWAYTAAAAASTRTDNDRGALEIGKWADMTMLTRSPLVTPISEWESVQVAATFVAGQCLYGRENLE